ncbi:MBL fold metallo-hydrolase [Bacillus canaveralius]|uniref:MBL fold metallo-hydrolase n=1 Tax=Bacillus canaveralius TaxID=1403243 RepID=A0A2N5GQR9_9BACI|nr:MULTISPECIES: MBL fold metallo-hydrolase [Bacillus]PLR85588.1 MBL fold metallo-hydrolase [Bacillus canaveralius]PLR86426.1 MBL fold metallo-hydrolase [Bacillus sp. V33-4]PLR94751.1 MBL fold metallo-hydrolase [Bacillus canaveralius]RSK54713.1 MBL fold metallo-hydrolase [Bacillus canaveralius]
MKVSILGGGSEVGASCLHINMADTNLLIDAGMRMHGDELLPALGMLDSLGKPDAILVTHAHADHIGALPVVHSLFRKIPIYATPPTADLMKIMMKDSYKLLEQRSREANTLPPYTEEQVNSLLDSLLLFPASGTLRIGNVKITSFRAGHILGAVMFLIEGEGEKLLITGDLSFKAGRTIPGVQVPYDIQPDVVIMESTYGNRAHTDRNTEERRLAEHVAEVVAGGGFALIPAFALGRAQEILLILQDYMEKGLIPEFPIYVDGLVTPISRIYKNYPHFLKGPVAHRILKNGDVFLTEGRCKAVQPKERDQVLKGKPGCIVASSGMLTGGASSWYAERLVSDEKNAIFITGYQDEESPGRKLLNLADGIENQLKLNGTVYQVRCRVGKYGLSAHADAHEMNRFIQALKPTYTLLVHGDDDARVQLADLIDPRFHPILAENGESYPFAKRASGKGSTGKRYRANDESMKLREKIGSLILYQPENENIFKLAICTGIHPKTNSFICQTLKGKQLRLHADQVTETIDSWNRSMEELREAAGNVLSFVRPFLEKINWSSLPNQTLTLKDIYTAIQISSLREKLAVALALQGIPSENRINNQDGTNNYKFDAKVKQQLGSMELPIQGIKHNPTAAMETVRRLLADNPRFIRCGVDELGTDEERLTVYFDFPDAVPEREKSELYDLIRKETGWAASFSDSVRQDLLQTRLIKLLGRSIGSPSIHLNDRIVAVAVDKPNDGDKIIDKFKEETGFTLQFNMGSSTSSANNFDEIIQSNIRSKRLENNQAIEEAKKWAADRGITIYKTGIKQQDGQWVMEVHFISPEIAMEHETDLEELSYRIGMPVTFAKNPKQNEIIRLTLEVIPETWELKKNPSVHIDKKTVAIKLASSPDDRDIQQINDQLKKETGYALEVNFL